MKKKAEIYGLLEKHLAKETKKDEENMGASSTVKLTKGYKEALDRIRKLEAQIREADLVIKKASAMDTIGDCVDVHKKANQYFLKHPWAIEEG